MPIHLSIKPDPNKLLYLEELAVQYKMPYKEIFTAFRNKLNALNQDMLYDPSKFKVDGSNMKMALYNKAYTELKKELTQPSENDVNIDTTSIDNQLGSEMEQNMVNGEFDQSMNQITQQPMEQPIETPMEQPADSTEQPLDIFSGLDDTPPQDNPDDGELSDPVDIFAGL